MQQPLRCSGHGGEPLLWLPSFLKINICRVDSNESKNKIEILKGFELTKLVWCMLELMLRKLPIR